MLNLLIQSVSSINKKIRRNLLMSNELHSCCGDESSVRHSCCGGKNGHHFMESEKEQIIRELAYHKWEEAGKPESDGIEFWLAAQEEVLSV